MEEQGYDIDMNILYQDNKSAILLESNGQTSAGKQSWALNVHYFFLTDQIQQGNVVVKYCPTDMMIGDYMTKPLQGIKFQKFQKTIMGLGGWKDNNDNEVSQMLLRAMHATGVCWYEYVNFKKGANF